ncbi:hypothetical protein D3C74_420510 [compost metagenome]
MNQGKQVVLNRISTVSLQLQVDNPKDLKLPKPVKIFLMITMRNMGITERCRYRMILGLCRRITNT